MFKNPYLSAISSKIPSNNGLGERILICDNSIETYSSVDRKGNFPSVINIKSSNTDKKSGDK